MFTKKCLDIIYQTLSGDTPYQRVLEDKFPTKNSEEKSPKQFRKKPLPKRFCLVYLRTETWNAWQFSKISFQATWNAYTWNAKRLFLRALGLGTWNASAKKTYSWNACVKKKRTTFHVLGILLECPCFKKRMRYISTYLYMYIRV